MGFSSSFCPREKWSETGKTAKTLFYALCSMETLATQAKKIVIVIYHNIISNTRKRLENMMNNVQSIFD